MNTIKLSDGNSIPAVGFGTCAIGSWQQDDDYVVEVILNAIKAGYRHFDTASIYGTERSLGKAIKLSGIPREDFYISTKMWDTQQGYQETLRAFEQSLTRLDMEYVDLYLVHWPYPEKTEQTWKAMEVLHDLGKARSLGLSNFRRSDIEHVMSFAKVKPVYNQLELHPYFTQAEMDAYCKEKGIVVSCWSPLGSGGWNNVPASEKPISDTVISNIADKYGVSAGQVILKWDIQQGRVVIPKAESENNILNNLSLESFVLTDRELMEINALHREQRFGGDPDSATADNLQMVIPD